jgi:3-hydroxybutyrate dehydrogenase
VLDGFGDARAIEAERAKIETEFDVHCFYNGADRSKPAEIAEITRADLSIDGGRTAA